MDQKTHDPQTAGNSNQADSGIGGGSEHSVDQTDVVIKLVGSSTEGTRIGFSESKSNDMGSSGGSVEVHVIVVNHEKTGQVDQGTSGCSNADGVDHRQSEATIGELESNRGSKDDLEKNVFAKANDSFMIDVDTQLGSVRGDCCENWEGERICRICHLNSEQAADAISEMGVSNSAGATTSSAELIQLGCGCKDELGIAHTHCAEAWFKLKGNRFCEICGETAKNVSGIGVNRFLEEWNERRFAAGAAHRNSSERGGCWRGQPFCNFLMACLVIAFVLPWFFRVNMF